MLAPRRAVSPLALAVLLALPPLAARAQEAPEAGAQEPTIAVEGEVSAGDLARAWAERTNLTASVDPQIESVHVRFDRPAQLGLEALNQVLDMHEVVLIIQDGTLRAHHRRNLGQKEGTASPVLGPDEDAAARQHLVTAVIPLRYGAGHAIFATLRGLLTRDPNRIGNVLYVSGPDTEQLVICDLGPKVAYYREIASRLDVPPRSVTLEVRAFLLSKAAWQPLAGAAPEAQREGLQALAAKGDAELLQEATLPSRDGRFYLQHRDASRELKIEAGWAHAPQGGGPVVATHGPGDLQLTISAHLAPDDLGPFGMLVAPLAAPIDDGAVRVAALSLGQGTETKIVAVTIRATAAGR